MGVDLVRDRQTVDLVRDRQTVDLVRDRQTKEPAPTEAMAISERLRPLGVIMQPTGDAHNVLKVKPPLCLDDESAGYFVTMLDRRCPDAAGRDQGPGSPAGRDQGTVLLPGARASRISPARSVAAAGSVSGDPISGSQLRS
jgi:hypothetical protein